ncbi:MULTISPECIES: choice-of-anchor tandem repeat GloVer-containing protein [unclassified Variovorax]|uniref:choice-of-anchor tandem repeat GloVer-containing protein n=1 Tax=unclassified Variovorax TaxID=663243 RepID=UPI0008D5E035|nr:MULTISPECIES: choice-of-anchor tandem repeat GloVer-containing protein [unclassified Variovorax]SEJ47261.1 GlyGly-CTERM domain-containing protein [Variovorax sp. OK202]SFC47893.1 GlyGly-CTERM domain-containing protein [Variovorax sp. OK212]
MHSLAPKLGAALAAAATTAAMAAVVAGATLAPPPLHAQTRVSGVTFTSLASFRPAGDDVTTPDGTVGWPGARNPTAPPLYALRPGTTTGHLYGGFLGNGLVGGRPFLYTATGLYSMQAGVSIYERLPYDVLSDLQGRVSSTPVQASDGRMYSVMTSTNGEANAGKNAPSNYTYSATVGLGLLVRTDADGTHAQALPATIGQMHSPNGALVIDADDNLYGIDKGPQGNGRIFKLDLRNTGAALETLHTFPAGPNGMKQVANDLIIGSDGVLYGVTAYNRGLPLHATTPTATDTPTGTAYRIDPKNAASFKVLHTFTLAEGEINVLDNASDEGFRHYPSGQPFVTGDAGEATLRSIGSGQPAALSSLVDGGDGYLYGGTSTGDCYHYISPPAVTTGLRYISRDSPLCGFRSWTGTTGTQHTTPYPHYDGPKPFGTLYRIAKDGSGGLQLLHTFSDSDGATPRGQMALGADGAIYGTTLSGGGNVCINLATRNAEVGCGTIYRIKPRSITLDGNGQAGNAGFEVVHVFSGNDGRVPLGIRTGADGRLYGVTSIGGSYTNSTGQVVPTPYGTVYQLSTDGGPVTASASLIASPVQFNAGGSTTLTWTTSNATNCSAASSAGDWKGPVDTYGSLVLTPKAGTYRYTLTCNVNGSAAGAQVSATTTIFVGTVATAEDGNLVSYGNGGGGPVSPLALLPLAGLWWLRRRRD